MLQKKLDTAENKRKTSKAQLKSADKWNKEKSLQIGIRAKTAEIKEYKAYAEKMGMNTSKFARAAMKYCIRNNISASSLIKEVENKEK